MALNAALLKSERTDPMIENDNQLAVARKRIARLQDQITHLRRTETNAANYHASVSGYIAEVDRMQLEVREYLTVHPNEVAATG